MKSDFSRPQAIFTHLARDQIPFGNGDLFAFRITGKLDDFHPVEQRSRDGLQLVGGCDEENLRKVVSHFQVVVAEFHILFRVEHFQQRRGRITMEIHGQFVHFVQHENRVVRFDPAQGLQDASRHGSDVGAAMAADLGLIAHASQGDANELAFHGTRNRLPQRGLANTGRTDKAQDHAFPLTADQVLGRLGFFILALQAQFSDGQELQDAFLDILQAVMVLVQDLAGMGDIQVILACPGSRAGSPASQGRCG